MKKMTIWGVGPKIMIPGYSILIVLSLIPVKISILKILNLSRLYLSVMSFVLISIGIIFLAFANPRIYEGLRTKKLVTKGLFGYVRNPMYVAHLFFLMPGICLLTNNAITLFSILCAVIIFYILIPEEEKVLEEYFGVEYVEYKNRVNRLIPKIRL